MAPQKSYKKRRRKYPFRRLEIRSENKTCAQLQLARGLGRSEAESLAGQNVIQTALDGSVAQDSAHGASANHIVDTGEVRAVEDVECFRQELQLRTLSDFECFRQTQVQIDKVGTYASVASDAKRTIIGGMAIAIHITSC